MPRWRSTGAGPSPGSPPHRAVGHAGAMVKVRIGYTVTPGPGVALTDLGPLARELERLGFDSLWLPESMLTGAFDPVVGLTHVAAVTSRLKVGTHPAWCRAATRSAWRGNWPASTACPMDACS